MPLKLFTQMLPAVICAAVLCARFRSRVADPSIAGATDNAALSLMKVLATDLFQRISEEMLCLANEDAGAVEPVGVGGLDADLRQVYMIARPSSIYAGANEVQRNIAARMILGPPSC